ncbi:hypothetical protein CR513_24587, partial [Mucuna pruriens]
MIVRNDGKVASDSAHGETSTSSESKSCSDDSHLEGDLLMVRRLMGSQMVDEAETQRENIFHSRCQVLGNWCSLIIDGGNFVNVTSERLVRKLALPTLIHSRPYSLQWLSDHGDLIVNNTLLLPYHNGHFENFSIKGTRHLPQLRLGSTVRRFIVKVPQRDKKMEVNEKKTVAEEHYVPSIDSKEETLAQPLTREQVEATQKAKEEPEVVVIISDEESKEKKEKQAVMGKKARIKSARKNGTAFSSVLSTLSKRVNLG